MHHRVNADVLHVYTPIEFLLLASFYRGSFESLIVRETILWTIIIFTVFCIINPIFLQNVYLFDTYTTSVEFIMLIIMSVAFMSKENDSLNQRWQDNLDNWFNTGILIYFSGALFYFMLSNYLIGFPLYILFMFQAAHATLLLILYILFSIGFIRYKHA
ncbi:hypothetical protein HH214_02130 [Mucilaginibacter robiniae]|uniref:Uncharacterized protein n=1 Tax=Mucilaginibacter robiniae TaxID=2728022 RepID=A0A7L5E348_9SPHI|nr:hypothetical protein [Mucilaginibacter robiniae]QJD94756.1 hypothetical protein HH214_02130 [Mucilaginibacter robiniae]